MDYLQAWPKYSNLKFSDLPTAVQNVAQDCLLDWLGCAIAGSREPLSAILRDEFAGRNGSSAVIGSDLSCDAATAALLNGASGHALDYDDTSEVVGCHATAPVLPAALAVAQEIGASGEQLLMALVVGVEIEARVGIAIGPEHYLKGWHTTATFGVHGATAAVAYLLQLNQQQYGAAMGMAASQASGLKANFGTMTKPFHAGRAAEAGVNSAKLAARGFTANAHAVVAKQGLAEAAGSQQDPTEKLQHLADRWLINATLFKYHAACYLTHAAIESCVALRPSIAIDQVTKITLQVHPALLDICAIEAPNSGLQAKFSIKIATAMAWLGIDTAAIESFSAALLNRRDVSEVVAKTHISTDKKLKVMQCEVVCIDKNAKQWRHSSDTSQPNSNSKLQRQKLSEKFLALTQPILGVHADRLLSQIPQFSTLAVVKRIA